MNKLSNVTNNEVVKKTLHDKLVAKVNNIDTSEYVLKSKYNMDKSDLEKKINNADKKICDASGLVKKHYNAKTTEIEGKIPSTTGLDTTAALTPVENKIHDVSNLVKKTGYDAKLSGIESTYSTRSDYNKFTSQTLDENIKQIELVD